MTLQSSLPEPIQSLDQILIQPRITASLRFGDRKSKSFSDSKSVTVQFTTSLLRITIFLMGMLTVMQMIRSFCRMKWKRKIKKKMKKHFHRRKK